MIELVGTRVLVLGLGASGLSAARFCAERGAHVVAADERPEAALGDLAEIGKIARNIDDISIDSAKVDLRERGGDDLSNRMNLQSILKDDEDGDGDDNQQFQETPKQRRASAMRRGAGTGAGYAENNKLPAKKNR